MTFLRKSSNQPSRGQKAYNRRPLTTYYRSKNQSESASPFKKKTAPRRGRKILFGAADILLIILLLAGLVYSLLLSAQPKLIVRDKSYHSAAAYQKAIEPMFSSLANRNKLSFNENALIKQIQTQFPEVQSARVELPFFSQKPTVWLNISKPAFNLTSGSNSFVIDSAGLAVAKTQELPELKSLVSLNDQSGFPIGLGKQVLASEAVDFINKVIAQSKRAKVPISTLTLPTAAQELDLRTADAPYFVKFYLGGDALTQTGQFLAARQKLSQSGQTPSQYLDVRIAGKIFYK
ncbi:hypothetical protein KW801_02530 [Candidatus Saccharibacteria bacterium]|nr:hypothetical protein [Candidatus Saccharibacteria bacterium]